jgi:hypothetical protein
MSTTATDSGTTATDSGGEDAGAEQGAGNAAAPPPANRGPGASSGSAIGAKRKRWFFKASKFSGAREGYAFKLGTRGQGYYLDADPAPAAPMDEEPPAAAAPGGGAGRSRAGGTVAGTSSSGRGRQEPGPAAAAAANEQPPGPVLPSSATLARLERRQKEHQDAVLDNNQAVAAGNSVKTETSHCQPGDHHIFFVTVAPAGSGGSLPRASLDTAADLFESWGGGGTAIMEVAPKGRWHIHAVIAVDLAWFSSSMIANGSRAPQASHINKAIRECVALPNNIELLSVLGACTSSP